MNFKKANEMEKKDFAKKSVTTILIFAILFAGVLIFGILGAYLNNQYKTLYGFTLPAIWLFVYGLLLYFSKIPFAMYEDNGAILGPEIPKKKSFEFSKGTYMVIAISGLLMFLILIYVFISI
jgi:hypothetical protein